MKKIFALLAIIFVANPAMASDWTKIQNKQYMHIQKMSGNLIYYYVKILNDGHLKKVKGQKPCYNLVYGVSDCPHAKLKGLGFYSYTKTGELIEGGDLYENWVTPQKGSQGRKWHRYACGAWVAANRHKSNIH